MTDGMPIDVCNGSLPPPIYPLNGIFAATYFLGGALVTHSNIGRLICQGR